MRAELGDALGWSRDAKGWYPDGTVAAILTIALMQWRHPDDRFLFEPIMVQPDAHDGSLSSFWRKDFQPSQE